ncbi:putative baseplate assembly protein [Comamonadaceae bacterium G21597-S1]|nr:putative baseplate assembly protein [Comamonadaceae bacterium G21597-S1]
MTERRPTSTADCDCCAGVDAVTPQRIDNPPALSRIAHRMGHHGDFVASMQARLSSTDHPALAALGTREASDFSLAIGDALACSLDVLGFYTERFAQEHYLRTATERLSVREMARLIGYELAPGVAASTHLAFTLQSTPGAPTAPIVIPVGTRVQSVPGQDEKAQSFETVVATPARAAWNAIPVQQDEARIPAFGDRQLWLAGLDTGLAVGDLLLIVGAEHADDPSNERWDVRVITRLRLDVDRALTEVRWQTGLGHARPFVLPAGESVRIFTFRKKTAAFGAQAPDWRALSDDMKADYIGLASADNLLRPGDTEEWPDFSVRAPLYPERRSGSAALEQSVLAATIDDIVTAAQGAAQGAATMAMQKAATAGAGIVMAGGQIADASMAMARQSMDGMADIAKLTADKVAQQTQDLIDSLQDTIDNPLTILDNVKSQMSSLATHAQGTITGTATALNPVGALEGIGNSATLLQQRARSAALATLGAAAAADTAALVVAAVTIARNLPPGLAPSTPQAMAEVARHFAAAGVARAGGSAIDAPEAGSTLAQVAARMPEVLQTPLTIAEQLLPLVDGADELLEAPRAGALSAHQNIIAEIDRAIVGSITTTSGRRAPLLRSPDAIDIYPANDAVVAGGWALLSVPGSIELYRITQCASASRAEYLLSGQTTRVHLSGELPAGRLPSEFEHAVRALAVHVQSEELELARMPLDAPVYGEKIALDRRVDGLRPGQALALRGKPQRIAIARGAGDLHWRSDDGLARSLAEGDELLLVEPPVRLIGNTPHYLDPQALASAIGQSGVRLRLRLRDRDGLTGVVTARGNDIVLARARDDDPDLAEVVLLADGDDAVVQTRERTVLTLAASTRHCYHRRLARCNANVAPATHGETVQALLGSGDGRVPNAQFELAQSPLTYVSAATASGRASTLTLRVNDVAWQEVPTLHGAAPAARVFETLQDDDGKTRLLFGDGVEGARLPSGSANLRVRYRKGLGVAGNVAADTITTLLSRPLGVTAAHNPQAATGGEDAETLERARENAPLTVLTLDRAVSIDDYAHFARAFAGIDKAHALWVPHGPARGVFLTIAGIDGTPVPETGDTFTHLREALATYGDPLVPLRLANYVDARFVCRLSVRVQDDYEAEAVLAAIDASVRTRFGFAQRAFGQTVSVDEVAAVAQGVAGVRAVQVTRLHRPGQGPVVVPRLFARLPVPSLTALPQAAELLTLAEAPIELELMARTA